MDPKLEAITPLETPPDLLKAMQGIIEDGKNDVARLPEPLFVQNLLPVLTDTSGNADLSIWLDIAGHGFRPIDVYDPVSGQNLFRVPSLYVQQQTKEVGDSRHSLAMVAHQANNYGAQHPAIAQTFLSKTLGSRPVDQQIDWNTVRQWNAILQRYGLPPVTTVPAAATASAAHEPSPTTTSSVPSTGALIASNDQDDF